MPIMSKQADRYKWREQMDIPGNTYKKEFSKYVYKVPYFWIGMWGCYMRYDKYAYTDRRIFLGRICNLGVGVTMGFDNDSYKES